jgi:hypothetical protein
MTRKRFTVQGLRFRVKKIGKQKTLLLEMRSGVLFLIKPILPVGKNHLLIFNKKQFFDPRL